jgi:hypothetical protein
MHVELKWRATKLSWIRLRGGLRLRYMPQTSVADPGCFIPDPTIAPSRIRILDPGGKKAPDPGSNLFLYNFICISRIRIRPLLHPGSGG